MVETRHITSPNEISSEGQYVLVCCGPVARDRGHPRGRTIVVRADKQNKVKIKEFETALQTAHRWAEANGYPTVYVIDMPGPNDAAK